MKGVMHSARECRDEKLTKDDLMHLKIAVALFQSNLQMKEDMPEIWVKMQPLMEKVDRMWRRETIHG
jgi:hypothetical protein